MTEQQSITSFLSGNVKTILSTVKVPSSILMLNLFSASDTTPHPLAVEKKLRNGLFFILGA